MTKNFGKMLTESMFVNFGGPAGSSAPGKVLRSHNKLVRGVRKVQMTRRPFLSLRVLIIYNKGAREILISNSVLLLAFLFLKNTQNTETL